MEQNPQTNSQTSPTGDMQAPPLSPELGEPQRFKTLGVRIEEDLHAQLTFIAQLGGSTIADEIRRSIRDRITAAQQDPALVQRASDVRAEIDREAAARREAIAGFFGPAATGAAVEPPADAASPAAARRRRGPSTSGAKGSK